MLPLSGYPTPALGILPKVCRPRTLPAARAVFVDPPGQPSSPSLSNDAHQSTPYQPPSQMIYTPADVIPPFYPQYPQYPVSEKDPTYFQPLDSIKSANDLYVQQQIVSTPQVTYARSEIDGITFEQFINDVEQMQNFSERESSPSSGDWSSDSDSLPQTPINGKTPARRERKKKQNREAATRYREKKRKEREVARATIDGLVEENDVLRKKALDIQTEIDYLKRLMREIGMNQEQFQFIDPSVPM